MPNAVTGGERTIEELASRVYVLPVLPDGQDSLSRKAAEELLKANPHLARLHELPAGTPIIVPEVEGVEVAAEVSPRGRQPFARASGGAEWTLQDEVRRLDHVFAVVFEGSIALTLAAVVLAFQESGAITWVAFIIAAFTAIPGWLAGFRLAFNPLSETELEPQLARLRTQIRFGQAALALVLVGVPTVGALAVGVLLFPDTLAALVGPLLSAIVGVVVAFFYRKPSAAEE